MITSSSKKVNSETLKTSANSQKKSAIAIAESAATALPFWKNSKTPPPIISVRSSIRTAASPDFPATGRAVPSLIFSTKIFGRMKIIKLETKSGVKNYQLLKRAENSFRFLAELGKPHFELPETPQNKASKTENEKEFGLLIPSEEIAVRFTFVDVGNPVAVIFVDDFDQFNWRRVGKIMESSKEMFPDRTNVVFVKVSDDQNIEIRIWERGAGETSSSGTCSIAAAVASAFTGKTGRKVSVHAEGGTTEAVWREDDEMMITGRADLVFCGEFSLESTL